MILKEIAESFISQVEESNVVLFISFFYGKEYETECCVSSLVCVVYIGIYKIGCNIYAKMCLLNENMFVDRRSVYWPKICLLNENVSTKVAYERL